ncbi:MAG: sulfotransferase [Chthoniobacteraceae bacterium]
MSEIPEEPTTPPLVIGATGGSGTQVVARIVARAGYELGDNLNVSDDAMDFVAFHDEWISRMLAAERDHQHFSDRQLFQRRADFDLALARHCAGVKGPKWGWKAPRSIYLLPFLDERFPGLKFIHVLRDGRDMAFSKNQNQLRKHGPEILSWRERWICPRAVQSILLWDRVNRRAAAYAEQHLGDRYLRLRFEELCREPVPAINRLLTFLGASADAEEIAREEISPPSTLGDWRDQRPAMLARMMEVAPEGLRQFGYESAGA